MITKAVYSHWEDNRKKTNGGFPNKKALGIMLALSVEESLKQFDEVELVTNSYGKELLIDKYKIQFTSVKVVLDQFDNNLNADLWAYIKIYAYSIQTTPFIHIDNDVIIWDKISVDKLNSKLLFQNREKFVDHKGYTRLIKEAKGFPKIDFDIISSEIDYAYNCGVVGCNDLEIIKKWKLLVDEFLFSPKNKIIWDEINDKHSHNHLFEQFFISAIANNNKIEVKTLLSDNFYYSASKEFKMTHLWGEAKRKPEHVLKVKNRLYKDYPQYIETFETKETHSEIFEDVYKNELWGKGQGSGGGSTPEITFEYRRFLQKFLEFKRIRTVADFGCGDWQFSRLIDWDCVDYIGYDCVKTVIENNNKLFSDKNISFKYAENIGSIMPAQLLIIKDVLIHWANEEIIEFFNSVKTNMKFKYILITNQTGTDNLNGKISTGDFRHVDINKEPFNIEAKIAFEWKNDSKTTYLITL